MTVPCCDGSQRSCPPFQSLANVNNGKQTPSSHLPGSLPHLQEGEHSILAEPLMGLQIKNNKKQHPYMRKA